MKKKTKKGSFVSSKKKDILFSFISLVIGGLSLSYFLSSFYSFSLSFKFVIVVVFSLFFFSLSFSLLVTHLKLTKDGAKILFTKDGFLNLLFVPFLTICLKDKIGLYNLNIWCAFFFILILATYVFLKASLIDWGIVRKKYPIKSILLSFISLAILILLYLFIFTFLSFLRHQRLLSGMDLAVFNQLFWNTIYGRPFELTLHPYNFLGAHMSPILILLAPIYALWQDPKMLLFLYSLFLGIGAIPIYLIAYHRLKDRSISLIFAFSYLLYPFLSRVNFTDFHETCIAFPLLSFTFLALVKRKFKAYFILLFLSLMVKEEVSLAILGLGIYTFFRIDKKIGIITIISSILWAFIALKILIPLIQKETAIEETKIEYLYTKERYFHLGKNFNEIAKTIFFHPISVFKTILLPKKLITVFLLFFPFGFLSLASPLLLSPIIPILLLHLLAYFKIQYLLLWQYSALIIPFVVISGIYGFGNIVEKLKKNKLQIAIPLSLSLLTIAFLSCLNFSTHSFIETNDAEDYKPHKTILFVPKITREENTRLSLFYLLKTLFPKDVPISAGDPFAPHLSSRKNIFCFNEGRADFERADFVILDLSRKTSVFNLLLSHLKRLEESKQFHKIFEEERGNGFVIWVRKGKEDELLSSAKRLAKENPHSHFILSSIYFHLGRLKEAQKEGEKAIKLSPDYPFKEAWLILGDIYFEKKDLDSAYLSYKKAVEIDSLCVFNLFKFGERAKEDIEKVISNLKTKNNIFSKKQLVFIYANIGKYQEAISLLKEILAIEPNDSWAGNLFNEIKNFL